MNKNILKEFSLSEKEIEIYLVGLKIGTSSLTRISKEAEIARSTTNDLLNSLNKKGFVSISFQGRKRIFSCVKPSIFKEKFKEKEEEINKLIPELESLMKEEFEKPKIELFEGNKGFKSVAKSIILESKKEYSAFVGSESLELFPEFHEQFRRTRKEKQIHANILINKTHSTKEFHQKDKKENRTIKFIDVPEKNKNTSLFIFSNKIAYIIVSKDEQYAITIESEKINKLMKDIFLEYWNKI